MSESFSTDELMMIEQAENKWWPVLFQSYSTSILDMMASPIKKAFLTALIAFFIIYTYLHFTDMLKNKQMMNNVKMYLPFVLIFIFGATYYQQWRENENLKEIALRSEQRLQSKQFDFLNNMVVQGEMFRGDRGGGVLDSAANLVSIGTDAYLMKDIYDSRKRRK